MARTSEGNLVEAARSGDSQAFGQLFDAWFDRVHDLSRRIVKDTGTAGEVAQDAFLTAWTRLDSLDDPDAFGGWLLRIARNASLNRLAKERRSVALDSETMTTLYDNDAPDHDPLAHMDQAARINLVWDAAAALGERDMSILDLHLRHGLGAPELAEELGTTANNAHQMLFTLRKRLGTNVRALVLWRAGRPACDDLRRTLAAAGIGSFDKQAVKVIEKHALVCDDCSTERSERLAPAALFGAAPVVAAPILLKSQAASALEASGVPMSGSVSLGGAGGAGAGGAAGTAGSGAPLPTSGPTGATPGGSAGSGASAGATGSTGAVAGASGNPADPDVIEIAPSGIEDGAGAGGDAAEGRSSVRRRVLAAAAVILVLIGLAVVVSGGTDDPDATDEVAAGDGTTSPAEAAGTTGTDGPSSTEGTTTTVAGGFVIVGEDGPAGTTELPMGDDTTTQPGPEAPPARPDPPVIVTPSSTVPTAPPSTTTTTTTTAPPPPPAPAPVITSFTAVSSGFQCARGLVFDVTWTTEHATGAILSSNAGQPQSYAPSGTQAMCVGRAGASAPTFRLVATGPGGDVAQEITGQFVIG